MSFITKKPLPSMAMSSAWPVPLMLPGVNICDTAAVFTPVPTTFLPALVPRMELEYWSANSARDDLKPVVATLAMLLPVTFRALFAA
ncbi:hypothetical protein D3C80_1180590 [compost metagenome]